MKRKIRTYQPARDVVPVVPARSNRELTTKDGATALAAELDAWWHSRGFPQVSHFVVRVNDSGWGVRSNLVGGVPPRAP